MGLVCCTPGHTAELSPPSQEAKREDLVNAPLPDFDPAQFPRLLPGRRGPTNEKGEASGVVRISVEPAETVYVEALPAEGDKPRLAGFADSPVTSATGKVAEVVSGFSPAAATSALQATEPEALDMAASHEPGHQKASTRRLSIDPLVEHPTADEGSGPTGLSAGCRSKARKPTPVVTKSDVVAAIERETMQEKQPQQTEAGQSSRKADSSAARGFLGSWWRRGLKRRGTGFIGEKRLKEVLAMYGEADDDSDEEAEQEREDGHGERSQKEQ